MAKGTSKRIKRQMEHLIQKNGENNQQKLSFVKGSFNNTQRFNDKKLSYQQYEAIIKAQQMDLKNAQDNEKVLLNDIKLFNEKAKEWVDQINDEQYNLLTTMQDMATLITQYNLEEEDLYNLIYLFEATYQIGNSKSIKRNNTKETLKKWWNKYGLCKSSKGKSNQLILKGYNPESLKTIYFVNGMQYKLAEQILKNFCREKISDKKNSRGKVDLKPFMRTDILKTYGVCPVCPSACRLIIKSNPHDFKNGFKYLLLFLRKFFNNLGKRGIDNKVVKYINLPVSDDVIKSDTFYVALDCEYVSRDLTENVSENSKNNITKVRNPDEVLSFQLYAINSKGTQRNGLIVHNTSHQHFVMSELISAIQQVIEPLRLANVKDHSKRVATVHLLTYFGGVDISCFGGWERFWNNTNMIVLKKNAPFSQGYVKKRLNDDSLMRIDITDLMNSAPVGGLKILGDMVNIPKIDTNDDDRKHGYETGFYKAHMDTYRKECPKEFTKYAMNDAIITLEYGLFLKRTLGEIPRTTGSYAASQVIKMRQKYPNQFISDPNKTISDFVKSKGVECVRYGQTDTYSEARKATFGGHNVAYLIGYGYGRIIDFDLAAAYNVGGHLLPIVDYSDTDYRFICPRELRNYMVKKDDKRSAITHSFRIKDCDFGPIGRQIDKTSPYLIGVGKFKIDYPNNTTFIDTPSHSSDKSPIYVKHYEDWCTVIDAYNAWKHGATVHVIVMRMPKQCQDGLNVFGDFQNQMIKLRNAAKAKMEHSNPGSPQYVQAYGEQLLYKLIANSTYGKTLQGAGDKTTTNFDTYKHGEDIPKSSITDPLIGANYTAFTRYLVSILYDASQHCSVSSNPLNITTDGLTVVIPERADSEQFVNEMFDYYNKHMTSFYFGRLNLADKDKGFELKANVVDNWFNVRTRVNGNFNYSDTHQGIFATASLKGQNSRDLFDNVKSNVVSIKNVTTRISNLTDMKYRVRNHYGHQEQWEQIVNVTLGYDFAYKPVKLFKGADYCYFATVPYSTREEHDKAKKIGGELAKMVPLRVNNADFELYLKTINEAPLINKHLTTLRDRDKYLDEFHQYCERHYLYDIVLDIFNDNLSSAITNYCTRWNANKSSLTKALRRVKNGETKVNYVAGWYFKFKEDHH